MNTHPDFEELFRLLEEKNVDYMVVGGYAVAFHGYPRFTKDIDLFFDANETNVERLCAALIAFGFQHEDLPKEEFLRPNNVLTFGVAPARVDLLNTIDGLTFADASPNAVRGSYGQVSIRFIGREDLIRNKRASGRSQDRVDAEELGSQE